jgi:hypothetical protein
MNSTLNDEQVNALFSSYSKECDVLLGLFRLAIPNWDQVEYVLEGKPHIGESGWHTIYGLFRNFNENHPGENIFPGGIWLSMGFSIDRTLGAWEIDISEMKFTLNSGP